MTSARCRLAASVVVLLSFGCAHSPARQQPRTSASAVSLELHEYKGRLRTVSVEIAGSPSTFLFDTGGGLTIITAEIAKEIGCKPFGRLTGHRMSGERVDFRRCEGIDLKLGAFALTQHPVAVFDLMALLPKGWPPVHGVISLKTLEDVPFSLDLGNNTLVIETPETFRERTSDMKPVAIRPSYVAGGEATDLLLRAESQKGALWLLVDSGNMGRVILAPHAIEMLGYDLSQAEMAHGDRSLLSAMTFDVPDLGEIESPVAVEDIIYDGNVGASFLERFIIAIDQAEMKMWAKPSQNTDWAAPIARRVKLPASLESRRDELSAAVVAAQHIVDEFARRHGWAWHSGPHFDSVEVFETQQELWKRILAVHGLPQDKPLPTKGLVAALDGRILMAVTPEVNQEINPEYAKQDDAWTRLLAHEIVHRLHVAVLAGDEEAMGPQWFHEGFAVYGSGQVFGAIPEPSNVGEALALAHDADSPNAYRRYRAAVAYLAQKIPLAKMVAKASAEDFSEWIAKQCDAPESAATAKKSGQQPEISDAPDGRAKQQIEAVWADFEARYASGDVSSLVALWEQDGDLFTLSGGILRGRDQIAKFFSETLSGPYKGSKFILRLEQVRLLDDTTALADGTWQVTGPTLPKGYPDRGIYTQVLRHGDDGWQIVSARPSVPLKGHTRNLGRAKSH